MLSDGSVLGPIDIIEVRPHPGIFGGGFHDVVINLSKPFIPEIDGDDTPAEITSLFHVLIDVHGLVCSMEIAIAYMYNPCLTFSFIVHNYTKDINPFSNRMV
jgi:hypothetical protein